MRDQDHVHAAERRPCRVERFAMVRAVVDVEHAGAALGAAHGQVGRDRVQARGLAAEQVDRRAACGVSSGSGFGDGRRGTDDEDALHVYSVTRRQKPEEKRGSR